MIHIHKLKVDVNGSILSWDMLCVTCQHQQDAQIQISNCRVRSAPNALLAFPLFSRSRHIQHISTRQMTRPKASTSSKGKVSWQCCCCLSMEISLGCFLLSSLVAGQVQDWCQQNSNWNVPTTKRYVTTIRQAIQRWWCCSSASQTTDCRIRQWKLEQWRTRRRPACF